MQNTPLTPELAPLLEPLLTTELAPVLEHAPGSAPGSEQLASLMKRIELDGMKQVQELNITGINCLPMQDLIQIMTKGSEEFRNNTGRNMTYSEMREMYG